MCPWSSLAPANLHFCERDLCAWIVQPASTWSNIGFFIVGVLVWRQARRDGAGPSGMLGPIAMLMGVCSIAFHATGTFIGQWLDLSEMFFESALFVVLAARRLATLSARAQVAGWATLVVVPAAVQLRWQSSGVALFTTEIVLWVLLELVWLSRARRRTDYRFALAAVALFAVSFALWSLDRSILCDPDNHVFGGHAAWHLLGAAAFAPWYRYFSQFERAPTGHALTA
jgi:hypothetical protein